MFPTFPEFYYRFRSIALTWINTFRLYNHHYLIMSEIMLAELKEPAIQHRHESFPCLPVLINCPLFGLLGKSLQVIGVCVFVHTHFVSVCVCVCVCVSVLVPCSLVLYYWLLTGSHHVT